MHSQLHGGLVLEECTGIFLRTISARFPPSDRLGCSEKCNILFKWEGSTIHAVTGGPHFSHEVDQFGDRTCEGVVLLCKLFSLNLASL